MPFNTSPRFTVQLCLDSDKFNHGDYYKKLLEKYNSKEYLTNRFKDSGLDLVIPEVLEKSYDNHGIDYKVKQSKYEFSPHETKLVNLGVKCAVWNNWTGEPVPYWLYPRSSIGKTKFRMANCVGIIDSGYRGNLMAMMDNISDTPQTLEANVRLFQICLPELSSNFVVEIVDKLNTTKRGSGGFGSTGK